MSSTNEIFKKLADMMEEKGVEFVFENIWQAKDLLDKEKTKKTANVLRAAYKIAGVLYNEELLINTDVSKDSRYWLQELLVQVTNKIISQDTSILGVPSINLAISLKKGDSIHQLGTVSISKQWVLADATLRNAAQWLSNTFQELNK